MVVGLAVSLFGQWVAFEIYSNQKLYRIAQNTAFFIHGVSSGQSLVSLPAPAESVFFVREGEGKTIATSNSQRTLRIEDYAAVSHGGGGTQVFAYHRRFSLQEYLQVLFAKPFAAGVFLAGLVLSLTGVLTLLWAGKLPAPKEERQEILKSMKVLREVFALGGLVPQESLKEAKTIVEGIIKKMEGRT